MNADSVGLVGVGLLGSAIAERMLASGRTVIGWDAASDRLAVLSQLGGQAAPDVNGVFRHASRIILSLPTSDIVCSILHEVEELNGRSIIDTTTGDPLTVEVIAREVSALGGNYIDATIAGSSEMVRRKEAIALIGGEQTAVAAVADILDAIALKQFHLGPAGSGSRMKLVVNLVLGLNRAVLAEGLAFARAYEMNLEQVLEVLRAGPTYSRAMDTKGPKMISGQFDLEARLSQHHKDVALIRKEAARIGALTPLSDVHEKLLAELEQHGLGGQDNSAIIRAFDGNKRS